MISLRDKPVLVTGAAGFLGGHIIRRLVGRGAEVIALVHDIHRDSYMKIEGLAVNHVVRGDITDLSAMQRIIADYEIKYVFHLAADAIVRKCVLDPIGCFRTNIIGTAIVLEASRQVGTVEGVLCMESDKTYGSFDEKDLPYKEDQALKPTNVYEVSKACVGYVARAYDYNYNIPTVTVRGANLYGPGDMNLSRLVPGSIIRILKGQEPVLYNGVADYIREFVYVEDASEICIQLMENIDKTRGMPINVGSGSIHKVQTVISQICQMMGTDLVPKIVVKETAFKEIEKQWLNLDRFHEYIESLEFTPMSEGLRQTIDWYRKFQNLLETA